MRDEERIKLYYDFGTIDWKSEKTRVNKPVGMGRSVHGVVRFFKLATLLWSIVLRNLITDRKE